MACLKSLLQFNAAVVLCPVVGVLGDLTDAKTADMHSSRQYEDEWQTYQKSFLSSGVLQRYKVLDIRGNHGKPQLRVFSGVTNFNTITLVPNQDIFPGQ